MARKQIQETQKPVLNKESLKKNLPVVVLGTLVLLASFFTVSKINKKVERDQLNNYICQIVDADPETHVMGMRCIIKEVKEE